MKKLLTTLLLASVIVVSQPAHAIAMDDARMAKLAARIASVQDSKEREAYEEEFKLRQTEHTGQATMKRFTNFVKLNPGQAAIRTIVAFVVIGGTIYLVYQHPTGALNFIKSPWTFTKYLASKIGAATSWCWNIRPVSALRTSISKSVGGTYRCIRSLGQGGTIASPTINQVSTSTTTATANAIDPVSLPSTVAQSTALVPYIEPTKHLLHQGQCLISDVPASTPLDLDAITKAQNFWPRLLAKIGLNRTASQSTALVDVNPTCPVSLPSTVAQSTALVPYIGPANTFLTEAEQATLSRVQACCQAATAGVEIDACMEQAAPSSSSLLRFILKKLNLSTKDHLAALGLTAYRKTTEIPALLHKAETLLMASKDLEAFTPLKKAVDLAKTIGLQSDVIIQAQNKLTALVERLTSAKDMGLDRFGRSLGLCAAQPLTSCPVN